MWFLKRKKDNGLPPEVAEPTQTDFNHRYIIHHVLYGYPDTFTTPGSYPDIEGEDFAQAVSQAERLIRSADLGVQSGEVLDLLISIKAQQLLLSRIFETRVHHHQQSLQNHSENLYQLANHQAYLGAIQRLLDQVDGELSLLNGAV